MSQPEKLAYCAWPAGAIWLIPSKPMYWPFVSLNTLGCNRAWYIAV